MAIHTVLSDREYRARFEDELHDSIATAKWIGGPEEHAEHDGQTLATRNHDTIMKWADERGASPATVSGTEHEGRPGVLRFDFPRGEPSTLETVDWDRWFETFDSRDLVMLFQETLTSGDQSNFFRFISPHREDA